VYQLGLLVDRSRMLTFACRRVCLAETFAEYLPYAGAYCLLHSSSNYNPSNVVVFSTN